MFNLQEELKLLPEKPGVYIMKDVDGEIIYIGKALSLKNRVRQYFHSSNAGNNLKTQVLKEMINSFEYIVTDTELEALILECTLIKKHKPKYNILLKDDKNFFPYIKINIKDEYPDIVMARKIEKDGAIYFGPYPSSSTVYGTIQMIKTLFPIKTCKKKFPRDIGKDRPCLNFHIGRCVGVCRGDVGKDEYREVITDVISFLKGNHNDIKKKLKFQMEEASKEFKFEVAADLRDKMIALDNLDEKQKIVSTSRKDEDYISFVKDDENVWVQIFYIREGKLIGRDGYMFEITSSVEDNDIIEGFIKQFYANTPSMPKSIYLCTDIEDNEVLEEWLSSLKGSKVSIITPMRGDKLKMIEMVKKNAVIVMDNYKKNNYRKKIENREALLVLKDLLGLKKVPERIEAYDISNNGKSDMVGSMIVFTKGVPTKKDYRKFKIKEQEYQNDYLAMEQVLTRRFSRLKEDKNFGSKPDLILMDGGKGHIAVAKKVLREFGLSIPVAGMVKDMKHNTRGLIFEDKEYDTLQMKLLHKFIVSVQNEAHRFAIEYNRKVSEKRYRKSELDGIEGIGPKKKKGLIKHFGSVAAIKRVGVEDIEAVDGISESLAKKIYEYFNG